MDKSPDAFRTISEVADLLETPAHVLRFWESRFTQIRPVKRAGGRRYYRPTDVALLAGIRLLLHDQGMTIRGVQKILREQGVRHVCSLVEARDLIAEAQEEWASEDALDLTPAPAPPEAVAGPAQVIAWPGPRVPNDPPAADDPALSPGMAGDSTDPGAPAPPGLADSASAIAADDDAPAADPVAALPDPEAVSVVLPDPASAPVALPDAEGIGPAAAPAAALPEAAALEVAAPEAAADQDTAPDDPAPMAPVPPAGDGYDDMPLFRFVAPAPAPESPRDHTEGHVATAEPAGLLAEHATPPVLTPPVLTPPDLTPPDPGTAEPAGAGAPDPTAPQPVAEAPVPADAAVARHPDPEDADITGAPDARAMALRLQALGAGRLDSAFVLPLAEAMRGLRHRLDAAPGARP